MTAPGWARRHHQDESSLPSIARRLARAQSTQKYCLVPFSTEQVQVGGISPGGLVPQLAQTTGWASDPDGPGR